MSLLCIVLQLIVYTASVFGVKNPDSVGILIKAHVAMGKSEL